VDIYVISVLVFVNISLSITSTLSLPNGASEKIKNILLDQKLEQKLLKWLKLCCKSLSQWLLLCERQQFFFVLFYFSSDVWRENSKPVLSFIRFLVVVIKREVLNNYHWLWFVSKMNKLTWNELVDVSFCCTRKNIVSRGIFALMRHPTSVTHDCHCMLVVDVSTHCLYVIYVSFL